MKRAHKKIISLTLLICALAALWIFRENWVRTQVRKVKGIYYVHKGDQAYAQGDIAKTLKFYKKGLNLYPGHYEAWYNLGNIYVVYEDYYSAVKSYQNAIKHNPKFVMARMNLGIVYSESMGFFDEAIEQFDNIEDIALYKLWIPFVYSNVKSIRGNKGIALFNKGVAYKQKATFLPLEKQHMKRGLLQNSIDSYTGALKYLKNNYDVYYNRAVAHQLRGDSKPAGLDYCKAIKIKPNRFEAHYNLGILLTSMKKYKEAMSELQKAAMLVTESPESYELQTAYIINSLREVSSRYMHSGDNIQNNNTAPHEGSIQYSYSDGRIVDDENLDKIMKKNLRTCAGYDIFIAPDDEENNNKKEEEETFDDKDFDEE